LVGKNQDVLNQRSDHVRGDKPTMTTYATSWSGGQGDKGKMMSDRLRCTSPSPSPKL